MSIKVIFINLEKRVLRRRKMELQLLKQNIPFKRISGVNSDLVTTSLNGEYRRNVIARELAHINARNYILRKEDNIKYIILEDDVVICDNFVDKLTNITNKMLFIGMKAYTVDKKHALLLNHNMITLDLEPLLDTCMTSVGSGDVSCDSLLISDNYTFVKSRDSYGMDIVWIQGKSERELIELADSYDYCVAFNSYGFLKYKLDYLDRFVYFNEDSGGIYIKKNHPLAKSYYEFVKNKDKYDNFLLKHNDSNDITKDIIVQRILAKLPEIRLIKQDVDNLQNFKHISDPNGISIVMTTHDRITQTLFTLDTIKQYSSGRNVQVILIDDSEELINQDILNSYPYSIDYVTLKSKKWTNPCVNYAIGFNIIRYDNVIIQNAEVCHIGDIIGYVLGNLHENNYLVFDVACTPDITYNKPLYDLEDKSYDNVYLHVLENNYNWYQHHLEINKKYHFLTAIKKQDLLRIGGFDYDYSFGACFDDTDFIYQIEEYYKFDIKIVKHNKNKIMGIHLFHEKSKSNNAYTNDHMLINKYLFQMKCKYHQMYGKWLRLYELDDNNANCVLQHMNKLF